MSIPPSLAERLEHETDPDKHAELCRQALELVTREQAPTLWAKLHVDLAADLQQSLTGDYAAKVEQGIDANKQALQVFTRATHPEQWALVQTNLGGSYARRMIGDRADNVERAIRHLELALEVFTQDSSPMAWAAVQKNLGIAYDMRLLGDHANNLERSIEHFEAALQVLDSGNSSAEWARVQHHLGNAYHNRMSGDRADNLEKAIKHLERALEFLTREAFPNDWAETQSKLGVAFRNRILGERTDNLEQAIQRFTQALQVYTHEAFPEEWATIQHSLGTVYSERLLGDHEENLEQAIGHYNQALEVRSREALPTDWAETQNNLGNAYLNRIRGAPFANIQRGIRHLELALEVFTRGAFPKPWARAQHNLGAAYVQQIGGRRADNLERAIEHFQLALQVRTRQALPEEWASTQRNLGGAYFERVVGDPTENLEQAIRHLELALQVYMLEAFPAEHLETQRSLGNLHFSHENWAGAHAAYAGAIAAGAHLWAQTFTEGGRRTEVIETAIIFSSDAYCLLRLGRLGDALLVLEQGKTRILDEELALDEMELTGLADGERTAVIEARQAKRKLESEIRLSPGTPGRRDEHLLIELLHGVKDKLDSVIDAARARRRDFVPTGLTLSELLSVVPRGGALVAFLLTRQGSAAFVLPHDIMEVTKDHIVELDRFTDTHLSSWMIGSRSAKGNIAEIEGIVGQTEMLGTGKVIAYTVDPDRLTDAGLHALETGDPVLTGDYANFVSGWIDAYDRQEADPQNWLTMIENVGQVLWDRLVRPVHERLRALGLAENASVLLQPSGLLWFLPLHAAWRIVDGKQRYFLDDYAVSYVPSGYVFAVSQRRRLEPQRQQRSPLIVLDPTRTLAFAPAEGRAVAGAFAEPGPPPLEPPNTSLDAVFARASRANYLHFACHGVYDWRELDAVRPHPRRRATIDVS